MKILIDFPNPNVKNSYLLTFQRHSFKTKDVFIKQYYHEKSYIKTSLFLNICQEISTIKGKSKESNPKHNVIMNE